MTTLRTAAQQALEALKQQQQTEPCPNCASLEKQNSELDRKLAELAVEVARFIEQARGII